MTVAVTGIGSVGSQPAGINCGSSCNANFNAGTQVTLTATPAAGQLFQAWGGACSGSGSTCTVTMSEARNVSAVFVPAPPASFVLTVAVIGSGAVRSAPAGIDCGSDCTEPYAANTPVQLTATPAMGQILQSWSGACTGSQLTCTLTMNEARSVTATFVASPGGGGTPPVSGAVFEAQAYGNDGAFLVQQANAQGARGFAFFGQMVFGATPTPFSGEYAHIYARDRNTSYTYELLATPTTSTAFASQVAAQGARGFLFSGIYTFGTLYMRDTAADTTYSVELRPAQGTVAGFLNQNNAQGARGFWFVVDWLFSDTQAAIYLKDNRSSARYEYAALPETPGSVASFVSQAVAQGQTGFRFDGTWVFSGEGARAFRNIYVRDTTQSSRFDYSASAQARTTASFISTANANAASGYLFLSDIAFFPDGITSPAVVSAIFVRPTNCSGRLCQVTHPFL